MNGSRKWLSILLVLTFFTGGVSGILAERFLFTSVSAAGKSHRKNWRKNRTERYRERLDLDDAQTAKLQAIFDAGRKEYWEIYKAAKPRIKEIRKHSRAEIRGILRPEQVPAFETMIKEQDERRAKYKRRRHERSGKKDAGEKNPRTAAPQEPENGQPVQKGERKGEWQRETKLEGK